MKKGTVLIIAGILIILSAVCLTGYNLYTADAAYKDASDVLDQLQDLIPDVQTVPSEDKNDGTDTSNMHEGETDSDGVSVEDGSSDVQIKPIVPQTPSYVLNPDIEMPVRTLNDQEYIGVLEIPDISLRLPVISKMSYPKLKKAPCRYSGSVYKDNLVIGAHCYEHFFAKLKTLTMGAQVKFIDVDGNLFMYEVIAKETISKKSPYDLKTGDWELTLFTCPILANTDTRIAMRCERIYPDKSVFNNK